MDKLHWWKGYNNAHKMMTIQGFTIDPNEGFLNKEQFEEQYYPIIIREGKYIEYTQGNNLGLVLLLATPIAKDAAESIGQTIIGYSERYTIVSCVVIGLEVKHGTATYNMKNITPTSVQRKDMTDDDQNLRRYWCRFFPLNEMQYNPLEHVTQPKVQLIIDEEEKEHLRINLVKNLPASERDKNLFELLPQDPMNNVVPRWLGAWVGDVIKYTRIIGGKSVYYRIVIPTDIGESDF